MAYLRQELGGLITDDSRSAVSIPILENKDPNASSVFQPAALLREARRQKGQRQCDVPDLCILDPDGDVVRHLKRSGRGKLSAGWPCYHTELHELTLAGQRVGIVGCAVGAPFAVLVAEQLFASGCRVIISLTSAGRISLTNDPPYFVVIDRALRDEGTSYHYAFADTFADADPAIILAAVRALAAAGMNVHVGSSWTTDAPFRETAAAVKAANAQGILAVEMEAAALYSFARKKGASVLCVAHVSNTMGITEGDFEKGEANGSTEALRLLEALTRALHPRQSLADRRFLAD